MKITLRRRIQWFRHGLDARYPLCCVVRFALHVGDDRQALQRGRRNTRHDSYVPCLIFHAWHDTPAQIAREVAA